MPVSQAHFTLTPVLCETIHTLACQGLGTLRVETEIGGLITTSTGRSSDYDVRLVDCDHKFSPFWRLSAEELSELSEAARQTEAEGRIVIAYFRSSTRQNVQIEADDRDNIDVSCPGVPFIVLARPSRTGSGQICVFRRGAEGQWELAQSISVASSLEPRAEKAPAPRTGVARPAADEDTRARSRGRLVSWSLALVLSAALLTWWFKGRPPDSRAVAPSPVLRRTEPATGSAASPRLGLRVNEENGKLHAVWDHDSPAARSAIFGSLEIRDSTYSKSIGLSPADITGGSIVYTPSSGDLTFRLVFTNANVDTTEEMIRFVGGESHVIENRAPLRNQAEDASLTAPPPAPPRLFKAPDRGASPAAPPKAPEIFDDPGLDVSSPVAPISLPSPEAIPAPVSLPVVTKPPVRASLPVVTNPPVPIHQSWPAESNRSLWKIYMPVTIGVTVDIDERGRVTKAVPGADAAGSHVPTYLVGLCVNAAKLWVFQPATRDGHPIASQSDIRFHFQPDGAR